MNFDRVSVAIIQSSAVYLDAGASLQKIASLIAEAAALGAKLVVCGETWLPGYPAWLDYCPSIGLWGHSPTKDVFARLSANSITMPGPECMRLSGLAQKHKMVVVIGVNERVNAGPGNGTLYNSLLTFDADGKLLTHRRKLMPTFTERLVWGHGDGKDLEAADTSIGRVGGLICWEHWMPLARQAMHDSGERIHAAVWPTAHELHQLASRHYAFEGRCFVLAAGLLMKNSELPAELDIPTEAKANPDGWLLRGGSAIIAPDGRYIIEPVFDRDEILVAEIDLNEIRRERLTLDVSGHYARPDVFELTVNRRRPGEKSA